MELKSYQVCMRHKTSAFKTNSQEILIIFSCTLQHHCYKTPERILSKQPHFFFYWLPKPTCLCMYSIQTTVALISAQTCCSSMIMTGFYTRKYWRGGKGANKCSCEGWLKNMFGSIYKLFCQNTPPDGEKPESKSWLCRSAVTSHWG